MRRALIAAALIAALVASACAGADNPPPPSRGLFGLVTRGPVQPVCRQGEPCDEPAARVKLTFSRQGTTFRTRTDERGRYRIRLRSGRYTVRAPGSGISGLVEPARVRVTAGRFRRVNLFIDTGIR